MTAQMVLFIVVAAVTLGSALMVVTTKNMIRMALWLIITLLGVAITFAILSAGFLAIVQVVIYIGAIAILMIFAIMLTRGSAQDNTPRYHNEWLWGLVVALVIFAGLIYIFVNWSGFQMQLPKMDVRANPVVDLGKALVDPNGYLLPFELASVLLLAALVGAIYIAWDRRKE
jgi:NADH-quinone oxidoreductase subunit J